MEFQSRTQAIQISGIRKFSELVSQYPNALSLTIGQPHLPTPEHIRIAAQRAIGEGDTGYTPNRGTLALREAAATYYRRLIGIDYDPATEMLVTVGATHALDIAMRTLLQPGDEVIIPAPAYPGYEGIVKLLGAEVVYVDTRQDGLLLTEDALRQAITPRTRMVILASPVNPTGVVYPRERLQALAEVLADTKVWVISDEIYCELQFAGSPTSISLLPGMRDRTIVIHGLSKSHSMTAGALVLRLHPQTSQRRWRRLSNMASVVPLRSVSAPRWLRSEKVPTTPDRCASCTNITAMSSWRCSPPWTSPSFALMVHFTHFPRSRMRLAIPRNTSRTDCSPRQALPSFRATPLVRLGRAMCACLTHAIPMFYARHSAALRRSWPTLAERDRH
ncbi:hypothetical protein GCM10025858_19810 [Alicyclobacillus sacchari]|nr:hypothetical protein GCM10025858_19810 [Alicyclobacillus sacchari]